MKLKVFSVLFVFVLCFSLVGFGQVIPDPNTGDPALDAKIKEIMCVLNMHRLHDVPGPPGLIVAYFQRLKSSNQMKFYRAEEGKPGHEIPTPAAIAAYWGGLREVNNFRFEFVGAPTEPIAAPGDTDFKPDKKADVTIKYMYTGSPDLTGSISYTLRHMRRCIWD